MDNTEFIFLVLRSIFFFGVGLTMVDYWAEKKFSRDARELDMNAQIHFLRRTRELEKQMSRNREDTAELGTLLDSLSRKLGYKYTEETRTRKGWEKRK